MQLNHYIPHRHTLTTYHWLSLVLHSMWIQLLGKWVESLSSDCGQKCPMVWQWLHRVNVSWQLPSSYGILRQSAKYELCVKLTRLASGIHLHGPISHRTRSNCNILWVKFPVNKHVMDCPLACSGLLGRLCGHKRRSAHAYSQYSCLPQVIECYQIKVKVKIPFFTLSNRNYHKASFRPGQTPHIIIVTR